MATLRAGRVKKLASNMPTKKEPDEFGDATDDLIMEGRAWNEDEDTPVVPAELRPRKPKAKR